MKPLTAQVRFPLIRYVGYLDVRSRIPESYATLISIVELDLFNSAQLTGHNSSWIFCEGDDLEVNT